MFPFIITYYLFYTVQNNHSRNVFNLWRFNQNLEAVGTKQIDQFLTLQKETETFHKTQMDDLKAVNQQQLTDMQNFFKEQLQVSAAVPKKGISELPSF